MPLGLPVARLINVDIVLTPLAAQFANFNSLLIIGDSDVINTQERMRSYSLLDDVANDFGVVAPEYKAAALFFGQIPQPDQLFIGRWAATATHAELRGSVLTTAEQLMAAWTAIDNGAFSIQLDGAGPQVVQGLDFSLQTNLNGVASVIDAALAGATCVWDGVYKQFVIKSDATGAASHVGYLSAPGIGTDISAMLKMTSALAVVNVDGIAAESVTACVALMDDLATQFYGVMFAAAAAIADGDHVAVAEFVQGSGNPHIYGVTVTNTQVLSAVVTTDLASLLKAANYTRTFCQYSENPHAVASFFGRAFTVDFNANNSTITLMYKQEPGIAPLDLQPSQVETLEAKRCNVFVQYNNNTAILEQGVMSGQAYFDEIHGLDWLANRIQTDVYNVLFTSPTKVPQTDAGTHLLVTTIEGSCIAGVNNGLLAPGVWNSNGFGEIRQGDFLPKGFYVFAPRIATQAQADREARKSVPIQVAAKLAGAIHTVDITVNVNR